MAEIVTTLMRMSSAIMTLALIAWLAIGYLLFRAYRATRPDWHNR